MENFHSHTIKTAPYFRRRVAPQKKSHKKIGWVVLVLLVALFLILFNYVLPSAAVTVVPNTQNLEKEFIVQLTTDKSKINTTQNIFGADIIEASESLKGTFPATGEKDMGHKANGEALFYNQTGRSQPLTTQVDLINDGGIVLVLKEDITIPPARVDENGNIVAGSLSAKIEAKEAGDKGNIGPGRINISTLSLEKQSKIFGEIANGLTGGDSKMVTVVSQDDLDNAKEELTRQIEPKLKEKMNKLAGDALYITDQLTAYDDSEIAKEVEVDAEVKNFDLSLNLKARVLAYDNKNLRIFLRDKILAELPAGQTITETEFGTLEIKIEKFDINLGLADLKIKAIFPVAEKVDLEMIKKNILGKSQPDARRYILSLPNVKDVQFKFSLSLNTKIPSRENRVKIKLGAIQ